MSGNDHKSLICIPFAQVATQESVFDGHQAEHYYPSKEYEGYASFDPAFRWTHREEKAVVRKVDIRILGWACVMFFSLNMNRSNLVRATADNFLKDLKLTQADYNLGNTLYRLCFLVGNDSFRLPNRKTP